MKRAFFFVILLLTLSISAFAQAIVPAPALMNFQGRLTNPNGTPVTDGAYTISFSLYNAVTGGSLKWSETDTTIARSGTFTVLLGGVTPLTDTLFTGNLWLEIKIGSNAPLVPRQQVVSAAYAFKADAVKDGSITANSLAPGAVTGASLAPNALNSLAWLLGGNSGTNPTTNFLGTTDNQPLVIKVSGRQGMRYSYAESTTGGYRSINVLGGSEINSIASGVVGATIAGGGQDNFTGMNSGYDNQVTANFGTISGGTGNIASGVGAVVSGGQYNISGSQSSTTGGGIGNFAGGIGATVSGGYTNEAVGVYDTISGGEYNRASSDHSVIGGGGYNVASGIFTTISGGDSNTASGGASVGGGESNLASGNYSTIGGGSGNTASGSYSTIPGGIMNTANGGASFAAGAQAQANHNGSFVWNDQTNAIFASTGVNQFLIHATGNVGINNNNPAYPLDVQGDINARGSVRANGVALTSDARYKTNVVTLNNALDDVLNLRGVAYDWDRAKWPAKNFPEGRQIGFIAQELEKIFPELVQTDANGYKSVMYQNVVPALVEAIKTQQKQIDAQGKQLAEIAEMKAQLAALTASLQKIEAAQEKANPATK